MIADAHDTVPGTLDVRSLTPCSVLQENDITIARIYIGQTDSSQLEWNILYDSQSFGSRLSSPSGDLLNRGNRWDKEVLSATRRNKEVFVERRNLFTFSNSINT